MQALRQVCENVRKIGRFIQGGNDDADRGFRRAEGPVVMPAITQDCFTNAFRRVALTDRKVERIRTVDTDEQQLVMVLSTSTQRRVTPRILTDTDGDSRNCRSVMRTTAQTAKLPHLGVTRTTPSLCESIVHGGVRRVYGR